MAYGNGGGVDLSRELDGFDDTEVMDKKPKLRPGDYVLKVDRIVVSDGRYGKNMFAECEVISASGPDTNPPGTTASYKVKLSATTKEEKERNIKNLKSFAAALLDEPASAVKIGQVEEFWAEDQPAKGQLFCVRAEAAKTKAGIDWVKLTPSAYRGK